MSSRTGPSCPSYRAEFVKVVKDLKKVPEDKKVDYLMDKLVQKSLDYRLARKRAIDAEEKAEAVMKNAAKLEEQKVMCLERPLRILGTRSKIEELLYKIYPLRENMKTKEWIYGKPDGMSTCDALNEMLTSESSQFTGDPYVMMFRGRLIKNHIPRAAFMKAVRWLYREFSDKTAHKMARFAPPLPNYDDVEGIKDMLKCVEIDQDVPALVSIRIILQPLDMPANDEIATEKDTSRRRRRPLMNVVSNLEMRNVIQ